MSNVIYLDVNSKNSKIKNETNNRFTYDLPIPLEIPTGTTITNINSIINLQGQVGQSIEIPEDIEEVLIYQYYIKDTSYIYPQEKAVSLPMNATWDLTRDCCFVGNGKYDMGGSEGFNPYGEGSGGGTLGSYPTDYAMPNLTGAATDLDNGRYEMGFSEIVMPMVVPSRFKAGGEIANGYENQYAVPFMGETTIKIPKGTYAISKIAQLITDQINGVKIPDNNDNSFINYALGTEEWNGFAVNNSTTRRVKAEPEPKNSPAWVNQNFWLYWNKYNRPSVADMTFVPYDNGNNFSPKPFDYTHQEELGFSAIGVHPTLAQEIRKNTIQGYLGDDVPAVYKIDTIVNGSVPTGGTANLRMFRGFKYDLSDGNDATDPSSSGNNYNNLTFGVGVGTTEFELSYSQEVGAFQMEYLHTPRFIPTFDKFGTKMSNPGQECGFIKRPVRNGLAGKGYYGNHGGLRPNIYSTFSQPMTSTTGIMVMNWAYSTAKRLGTKPNIIGQNDTQRAKYSQTEIDGVDKFRTYREWFDNDNEAKKAWETTLWYRLGFSYDDIQNPTNFKENFYPLEGSSTGIDVFKNEGFTTDQKVDTSLITTISTLYSGISQSSKTGQTDFDDQIRPINATITGVQQFSTLDVNIPSFPYNNNSKRVALYGNNSTAFNGSLYNGAVMAPFITKGEPSIAGRLPILSDNGYIIISSSLVEPDDVVKDGTYLGVLDLIPKSNLNNQDYINDRNVLRHTISNPKVINTIDINILNPDLTDVDLEPNSSILLEIQFPTPKPTVLLANAINQQTEANTVKAGMSAFNLPNQPNVASPLGQGYKRPAHPIEHSSHNHAENEPRHDPRGRRSPSPEPTPEALERARIQGGASASPRLRARGERGRFKGKVPQLGASEEVIAGGGRKSTAEVERQRKKEGDSGVGTKSRSAEPKSTGDDE